MSSKVLSIVLFLFAGPMSFGAPSQQQSTDHPGQIQNDAQIVDAVHAHKGAFFVEGANLVVTRVLPDDTQGLPHQKWEAKLSDGSVIQVVYNSDMGARVPLKNGDQFAVGGQFLWLGHTGLIHWLHDDPRGTRPDGYVYFNGTVYGDSDHEDQNIHP